MPSLHALPSWKPKASHAAVLLAIANLMYVPTALATPASCGAIASDSNLGTDTYDCTVSDGASVNVQQAATIVNQANGAAITYSALAGANGNVGTGKTLTNNGTVSATGTDSSATIPVAGIRVDGQLLGSLSNSSTGTVSATASTTAGGSGKNALAAGISVYGLAGTLNNNGTVTATASNSKSGKTAKAYGIHSDTLNFVVATGSINNTAGATISTRAENSALGGNAEAYGLYYSFQVSGLQQNAGTITATAVNSALGSGTDANAVGVKVEQRVNSAAEIRNSGTIEATGINATAGGEIYTYVSGIDIYELYGKVSNTGTIRANASGEGTGATVAMGLRLGYVQDGGLIQNSGSIAAVSTGNASYYSAAEGVYADYLAGTLNNSGTISGQSSVPGQGYSLHIANGSATINNLQGGVLRGSLLLDNEVHPVHKYGGSGASLNNAGLVDLRLGDTGHIVNNFTQTGTGVLRIAAQSNDPATGYSQLRVDGTATVAGSADVDVQKVNTLVVGQKLMNVVSAGTLHGNFGKVTDNSALFDFRSLSTEGSEGHIDIEVLKSQSTSATQAARNHGNNPALGAAAVIDRLIAAGPAGGDMDTVITALGQLGSEHDVSRAVSQTLPLLTAGAAQATRGALHGTNRVVQARQEGQHGRSSGDEFFTDRRVWARPFGSWADQADKDGASGYTAKTYGMVVGADTELNAASRLGVAVAYASSKVDGKDSAAQQRADVDTYQLVVYGSHSLSEATDLNVQADVGAHRTSGERQIAFGGLSRTAKSDYNSWSAHIGAGLAHTLALSERTSFTPSLRADYTVIRDKGYTETGAGALNLNVDSNRAEELIVGVDGKLSQTLNERTTLVANLGAGYDLLGEQSSIVSAFAGTPSAAFTTKGIEPSKWLGRGGLGLVNKVNDSLELSARYDIEFREGFTNQTASVKARWMF